MTIDEETAEERGLYVVRLHQALEEWRERRAIAADERWGAAALAMIAAEIARLEREIADRVRQWM